MGFGSPALKMIPGVLVSIAFCFKFLFNALHFVWIAFQGCPLTASHSRNLTNLKDFPNILDGNSWKQKIPSPEYSQQIPPSQVGCEASRIGVLLIFNSFESTPSAKGFPWVDKILDDPDLQFS